MSFSLQRENSRKVRRLKKENQTALALFTVRSTMNTHRQMAKEFENFDLPVHGEM
jgi:hypothetical protein